MNYNFKLIHMPRDAPTPTAPPTLSSYDITSRGLVTADRGVLSSSQNYAVSQVNTLTKISRLGSESVTHSLVSQFVRVEYINFVSLRVCLKSLRTLHTRTCYLYAELINTLRANTQLPEGGLSGNNVYHLFL